MSYQLVKLFQQNVQRKVIAGNPLIVRFCISGNDSTTLRLGVVIGSFAGAGNATLSLEESLDGGASWSAVVCDVETITGIGTFKASLTAASGVVSPDLRVIVTPDAAVTLYVTQIYHSHSTDGIIIPRATSSIALNFGVATIASRVAAQIGNATGAADFGAGAVGAQTLRVTMASGGPGAALDFGTPTTAQRTAAQIGNATGAADFGAGAVGAQVLRTTPASDSPHLLATRHETVTTPLAARLSDGTDFIVAGAIAASQKTISTAAKALDTISLAMGWDGTIHRELAVDTTGRLTTSPTGIERVAVGTPYYRDYTTTNLTAGAWTQIIASTSARIRKLDIFDSSGSVVMVGVGGVGAEVEVLRITPGGNGAVELTIPIGSRVSIQSVTGTLSVGLLVINMFT